MYEMKKLRLGHTYLKFGLRFFIFTKESFQNVKKLTKKVGKNSMHVFTRCACTQARAMLRAYLICLGDKCFHLVKVWWRSMVIWLSHDPLKKLNGQIDKQTNGQTTAKYIKGLSIINICCIEIIIYGTTKI